MADIYLEKDINVSLRAVVEYDSDGQSLTANLREENEIQVEIHKEESAEDKDDKEEFQKIIFVDFQLVPLFD